MKRLAKARDWQTLASMRVGHVVDFLAKLHRDGKSARTQNAYRDSLVAFCNYCVRRHWLPENTFRTIPKAKLTGRRPRRRRAFTVEEFQQLVGVHPVRGKVYQIAALSGLRREELSLLESRDFVLGDCPQWRMRAEITKGKRYEVVPMLPECADVLKQLIEGKSVTEKIFATIPLPRTLNRDLQRAGIAKRDVAGRQADFHALRYFFCTLAGKSLPIQVVKVLMRHQDIRTTVNLYMDLGLEDVAQEAVRLPRLLDPTSFPTSCRSESP